MGNKKSRIAPKISEDSQKLLFIVSLKQVNHRYRFWCDAVEVRTRDFPHRMRAFGHKVIEPAQRQFIYAYNQCEFDRLKISFNRSNSLEPYKCLH